MDAESRGPAPSACRSYVPERPLGGEEHANWARDPPSMVHGARSTLRVPRTAKRSAMQRVAEEVRGMGLAGRATSAIHRGNYIADAHEHEVPQVLDGFRILCRAPATTPTDVYVVDVSGQGLHFVIQEDLALFPNLHTIRANDNLLSLVRLGDAPALRRVELSLNEVDEIELEVESCFPKLEFLDLSFNRLHASGLLILGALPALRHLDLAGNGLRTLPEQLADMICWRDEVIRMLLRMSRTSSAKSLAPRAVGAPLSAPSSLRSSMELVEPEGMGDRLQQLGGPGFPVLDTLVLDNNQLGPEALLLLGKLPALRKLSVNHNRIISLQTLAMGKPVDFVGLFLDKSSQDTVDYTHWIPDPETLQHYEGFPCLEELHLAHNDIVSSFDLVGLVYLPALKRVWLEGNTVMLKKFRSRRRRGAPTPTTAVEVFSQLEFEPLRVLPSVYHIAIMDACFQQPRSPADKPVLLPYRERKVRVGASRHASVYHVQLVRGPTARPTDPSRRTVQYSDQEILHILRQGQIPSIKELCRLRQAASRGEGEQELDDQDVRGNIPQDHVPRPPGRNAPASMADGRAGHDLGEKEQEEDRTFITSVRLPREPAGSRPCSAKVPEPGQDSGDNSDDDEEEEAAFPAPGTIQQSIRALRHLVHNPASYWRVVEESYTKPTASTKRHAQLVRERLQQQQQQQQQQQHQKRLLPVEALDVTASTHDVHGQARFLPWRDARNPARWLKPMGPLDEMQHVVDRMDAKLQLIDANLDRVLSNQRVHLNAAQLLSQLQHEYERIERTYLVEAKATIELEKARNAEMQRQVQVVRSPTASVPE